MIQTQLDLIERIVQKTKTFGICWACSKRYECWNNDEKEKEFASGCVDFNEEKFLDEYNILNHEQYNNIIKGE